MSLKKDILWRVSVIYFIFLLISLIIIIKILYLQFSNENKWLKGSNGFVVDTIAVSAKRGNIYSSDERLLATSVNFYDIRFDPLAGGLKKDTLFKYLNPLSDSLANLFGHKSGKTASNFKQIILKAYNNNKRYILLAGNATYGEKNRIKNFPIFNRGDRHKSGLIVIEKDMRVLPHDKMASRFVGYVKSDIKVGIEKEFDNVLGGESGLRYEQRIAGNVWIPINNSFIKEPKDGYDIVTTIDITLQDFAAQALKNKLNELEAEFGVVVVMEVKSGEIKAIANLKKNKKNRYWEDFNHAVGSRFDPGSTFKLPVLIAALEKNKIKLDDTINIGYGRYKYFDQYIKDDNSRKNRTLTIRDVFKVSSNIGMVKAIDKAFYKEPEKLIEGLCQMKLNQKIGTQIEYEPKPLIKFPSDKENWYRTTIGYMAHGYEVELTPLQLLTFYNAVANGGKMIKPKFVREIRHNGRIIERYKSEAIKNGICSKSTLKKAHNLLFSVVNEKEGTAYSVFKNSNIKVAGKTGTCQVYDPISKRYNDTIHRASFVGYFPANNPQYSCIVVVSGITESNYTGSEIAAPVFLEIAQKINAYDVSKKILMAEKKDANIPYTKDGNLHELNIILKDLGIAINKKKWNNNWITTIKQDKYIEINKKEIIPNLVPNVIMMGAKDAIYLLENAGLKVSIKGRGTVKNQSIIPGTRIVPGQVIELEMSAG